MTEPDTELLDTVVDSIVELLQKAGLPASGPQASALTMFVWCLLRRDLPSFSIAFDFQDGARLREYALRDEDGRLLRCVAFRSDGSEVEESCGGEN